MQIPSHLVSGHTDFHGADFQLQMIGVDGWGFLVICECGVLFPLVLESATVDGFRICVWLWEAGSSLIMLIYEAFKKKKLGPYYVLVPSPPPVFFFQAS